MTALLLGVLAGYGTFLLYTAVALGWSGLGPGSRPVQATARRGQLRVTATIARANLDVVAGGALLGVLGAALGFAVFGGLLAAVATAAFAATFPVTAATSRRQAARAAAQEAWPRLIEEIRLRTGSLGRSIPQALFEVGAGGPVPLRPAFAAAQREWLITTDLDRALDVLKAELADPTADATCETLLVAHEVGGTELDRRLEALVDDRIQDVQGRKDARARQAGVRFARRFVLLVPLGMAVAGMSLGEGRAAYATAGGQIAVSIGVALVAACWLWAGRIMQLPEEDRVFAGDTADASGGGAP